MKPELQLFTPSTMTAKSRLIVCERLGIWAARIRPHLPRELALRQTRSLDECREELAEASGSLLVVEVTEANLAEVVALAADLGRRYPHARLTAVADRAQRHCEALLREAGAIHFATLPSAAHLLAQMAARHAARVPQPRTTLAVRIWESLPWHEAATG